MIIIQHERVIWVGIVIALIFICILEFIFLGGLEALFNLFTNIQEETIKIIQKIIELINI